jgi:hypothetical protein
MSQKIETSKGILKYGEKTSVFSNELCKKIRKRFKMNRRQLSNSDIYQVIMLSNIEIGKWLLENPEGFNIFKNMGTLVVSKYTPINHRENKEETIEKIKNSNLSEYLKERRLKKYSHPQRYMNLEHYLDWFRFMWFNRKNTTSKKAHVYRWEPTKQLKQQLAKKVKTDANFYSYKFQDFYKRRINQII